ncbi:MAG: hypothetical protein ACPGU9_08150 [Flavobacteriaceae bacterium]
MTKTELTTILKHPEQIDEHQTMSLLGVLHQYPYLQSARALYLKGLKNQDSYLYNNELKVTAAHTTDRSILFDYITSSTFNQNNISKTQQQLQEQITTADTSDIELFTSETASVDQAVLDPNLFEEKAPATTEDNLGIGKPLSFDQTETHSFQEWLQLTNVTKIERVENTSEESSKSISHIDLIDKFISSKPKIVPTKKPVSVKNLTQDKSFNSDELMTETLAKVYLEQKNYKKAIQAYRILSLKYPEKNSFFADRISDIEKIEINNTK